MNFNQKIASTVLTMLILSGSMCATAYATEMNELDVQKTYETVSQSGFISKELLKEGPQSKISRSNYEELLDKLINKLNSNTTLKTLSNESSENNPNNGANTVITKDEKEEKVQELLKGVKPLTKEEALSDLINILLSSDISLETSNSVDNLKLFDDYKDIGKNNLSTISTALQNNIISISDDFLFHPQETPTYQEVLSWIEKVNTLYTKNNKKEDPFYNIDPSQNVKVNPEVDNDGNISWNTVKNISYYTVLIKNSEGQVVFESDVHENTTFDSSTILDSNTEYNVIIGAVLEDGVEVYSTPLQVSFLSKGDKIVEEVKKYLGVNYVWGGTTPKGFDCSGLTQYVCSKVGIKINRVADAQYKNDGTLVSRENFKPGDLLYFGSGNYASHTGIYVGNGMMIHAPQSGDVVKYSTIDSGYYKSRLLGGKRVY